MMDADHPEAMTAVAELATMESSSWAEKEWTACEGWWEHISALLAKLAQSRFQKESVPIETMQPIMSSVGFAAAAVVVALGIESKFYRVEIEPKMKMSEVARMTLN